MCLSMLVFIVLILPIWWIKMNKFASMLYTLHVGVSEHLNLLSTYLLWSLSLCWVFHSRARKSFQHCCSEILQARCDCWLPTSSVKALLIKLSNCVVISWGTSVLYECYKWSSRGRSCTIEPVILLPSLWWKQWKMQDWKMRSQIAALEKNNASVLLYFPAVLFGLSFSVLHFLSSLVSPVLKKSCVLTTAYVLLTDELLLIAEHMSSSKCRMSNSL